MTGPAIELGFLRLVRSGEIAKREQEVVEN